MAFDYDDAADTPDEVVRGIAAEMSDSVLKPLTDVEIAEREEWLHEHHARVEQERIAAEEYLMAQERQQAEVAQQAAARSANEAREKARIERQQQLDRELYRRDMLDLRMAAAKQDSFRQNVLNANAN